MPLPVDSIKLLAANMVLSLISTNEANKSFSLHIWEVGPLSRQYALASTVVHLIFFFLFVFFSRIALRCSVPTIFAFEAFTIELSLTLRCASSPVVHGYAVTACIEGLLLFVFLCLFYLFIYLFIS